MSVNAKLKAELSDAWDKAEEAGGSGVPDGTYGFKIVDGGRFEASPKPHYKHKVEVMTGNEEVVGETLEIRDNLETKDNMGWFKSRLARLNITNVSIDDIMDGTLAEQMKGKTFEGQAKTKGGFLNVYVNRLTGESDGAEEAEKEESEEKEEKAEKPEGALEEGDQVKWTSKDGEEKSGKVLEVKESEGLARVEKEDGSVVRVPLEKLEKAGAAEESEEKEEKEEAEESEFKLPEPDAVDDMTAKEVKEALGALGFEAADVKNPRGVLHAFCTLGHEPKAKIELSEVSPLAEALGVTVKKGSDLKEQTALLSKAVQKRIG